MPVFFNEELGTTGGTEPASYPLFVKIPRMHRLLHEAADDAFAERNNDEEVEHRNRFNHGEIALH